MEKVGASGAKGEEEEDVDVEAAEARRQYEAWKVGRCLFRCAICSAQFPHSPRFHRHLRQDHGGMAPARYEAAHGCARAHTERVRCLLCGRHLVFEYGRMRVHMRDAHDMQLGEYFVKYIYQKEEVSNASGAALSSSRSSSHSEANAALQDPAPDPPEEPAVPERPRELEEPAVPEDVPHPLPEEGPASTDEQEEIPAAPEEAPAEEVMVATRHSSSSSPQVLEEEILAPHHQVPSAPEVPASTRDSSSSPEVLEVLSQGEEEEGKESSQPPSKRPRLGGGDVRHWKLVFPSSASSSSLLDLEEIVSNMDGDFGTLGKTTLAEASGGSKKAESSRNEDFQRPPQIRLVPQHQLLVRPIEEPASTSSRPPPKSHGDKEMLQVQAKVAHAQPQRLVQHQRSQGNHQQPQIQHPSLVQQSPSEQQRRRQHQGQQQQQPPKHQNQVQQQRQTPAPPFQQQQQMPRRFELPSPQKEQEKLPPLPHQQPQEEPGQQHPQQPNQVQQAASPLQPQQEQQQQQLVQPSSPSPSASSSSITTEVENLCTYKCLHCPETNLVSWNKARSHAWASHGVDLADQERQGRTRRALWLSSKVLHRCQVPGCSRAMNCDLDNIGRHVRKAHGLQLSQYKAVAAGSLAVPPKMRLVSRSFRVVTCRDSRQVK